MLTEAQRTFVSVARVARLATANSEGVPFVVPVCPVLHGDRITIASEPGLKIRNLRANPQASIVFDEYDEAWKANQQVVIRGQAAVVADGPEWNLGKRLLDEKYPQYEPLYPITQNQTLIIWIDIERVTFEGV